MLIGELAGITGTTTRALRYYEEQGLLLPERTPAGYRVYGPDALRRVKNIRRLFDLGFTVANVQAFLPYLDDDLPQVFSEDPQCPDGYAVGAQRVAELNERIETLTRLRDKLVAQAPWLRTARPDRSTP